MRETVKLTLAAAVDLCVWLAAAIFGVVLAFAGGHAALAAGSALWHLVQR